MSSEKRIHQLIEDFIQEERSTESNPFLSTRVMAAIEKQKVVSVRPLSPVWKTAVIVFGLFVAVFSGIAAGNLYQTKSDASDVVLINDNSIENFSFYTQMGNE